MNDSSLRPARLALSSLASPRPDADPAAPGDLAAQLAAVREQLADATRRAERAELRATQAELRATQAESGDGAPAAEALRARERLLSTLLEHLPVGLWYTDPAGVIIYGNPAARQIWRGVRYVGPGQYDVYRAWWSDTGEPLAREDWALNRVLASGQPVLNELIDIACFDGARRTVINSAVPIPGDASPTIGAVIINQDVTELRQVTQQSRLQAQLLDQVGQAVIATDLAGHVTYWNRAATQLFGWTPEEVLGHSILEINVPQPAREQAGLVLEQLGRGESWAGEYPLPTAGALPRHLLVTDSPIVDDRGRLVGVVTTAAEITEQRRGEARQRHLAEASRLLGASLDLPLALQQLARLAIPMFGDWFSLRLFTDQGDFVQAAVAHIDPAQEELARQVPRLNPQKSPRLAAQIDSGRALVLDDFDDALLEQVAENAEELAVLRRLAPRTGVLQPLVHHGRVLGSLSCIRCTPGQVYDAEEVAIIEDLAQRIAAALENARLYRDLQEASRRKDEFLAMLSHELRNPLAVIASAVQVFKLRAPDEPVLQRVREAAERQVRHMARLLDDLLDVSRITRGKISLRREMVELSALVDQAVQVSRPLAQAKKQELTLVLAAEPLHLLADPDRLLQVATNLVNNAVKFTPVGGQIHVELVRGDGEALLRVRDNGEGISAELLPHVFELFVQADRSLDRTEGGLGIGLTLVRSLAQLHGGSVEVSSPGLGQGSEFVVRLPLAVAGRPVAHKGEPAAV